MPAMRRRVRGSAPDHFELNLTPLLDIILQLITFFMMLVHFGTRIEGATLAVRLPVAPAALPSGDLTLDRLVVAVDRQGRLLVDGEARSGASAASWWHQQANKRREGRKDLNGPGAELRTAVVIRADRDAAYGDVRKTLALAQSSGFAHFTLVILREERP
jgi:biopolymer transport protein ExbD